MIICRPGSVKISLKRAIMTASAGVSTQALGDGADDLAAGGAVRVQGDVHRQVVIRSVDLVDDVVVEGVGRDDAAIGQALV